MESGLSLQPQTRWSQRLQGPGLSPPLTVFSSTWNSHILGVTVLWLGGGCCFFFFLLKTLYLLRYRFFTIYHVRKTLVKKISLHSPKNFFIKYTSTKFSFYLGLIVFHVSQHIILCFLQVGWWCSISWKIPLLLSPRIVFWVSDNHSESCEAGAFFYLKAHSFRFFSVELNFAETEAASVQKQQEVFKQIDVSIL